MGTILEISDGFLIVKTDNDYGSPIRFHPRQCTRLKPKRKAREIWMNIYPKGHGDCPHSSRETADACADPGRLECILFREVLPKKGET